MLMGLMSLMKSTNGMGDYSVREKAKGDNPR